MGIHIDPAVVAIDNQLTIGQLLEGQLLDADYGRDTHGPRQYRGVTVGTAAHRHDAHQLFARNFSQRRGGELLGHQHRRIGIVDFLPVRILQVAQHPGAEIADVHCALAQIGVLHALKMTNMAQHDLTQRALRPLTGFDECGHLSTQRRIIQNAQVNPKQRAILGAEFLLEVLSNLLDIAANTRQRLSERFQLSPTIR